MSAFPTPSTYDGTVLSIMFIPRHQHFSVSDLEFTRELLSTLESVRGWPYRCWSAIWDEVVRHGFVATSVCVHFDLALDCIDGCSALNCSALDGSALRNHIPECRQAPWDHHTSVLQHHRVERQVYRQKASTILSFGPRSILHAPIRRRAHQRLAVDRMQLQLEIPPKHPVPTLESANTTPLLLSRIAHGTSSSTSPTTTAFLSADCPSSPQPLVSPTPRTPIATSRSTTTYHSTGCRPHGNAIASRIEPVKCILDVGRLDTATRNHASNECTRVWTSTASCVKGSYIEATLWVEDMRAPDPHLP
nr:hypothetical protein CFP56_30981 [Quercus suber]